MPIQFSVPISIPIFLTVELIGLIYKHCWWTNNVIAQQRGSTQEGKTEAETAQWE